MSTNGAIVTIYEILAELKRRAIEVRVIDGKLRYSPKDAVPADLHQAMSKRRLDLVATFTPRTCQNCGRTIIGELHYWTGGKRRCEECYSQWLKAEWLE